MQQQSVYDEGYDALDVNTRAAVAYVERHKPEVDSTQLAHLAKSVSPQVARTLIVVDAACDIPKAWLDQHSISVMPRLVRVADRDVLEVRDNENAYKLFDHLAAGGGSGTLSAPLASAAMRNELHRWVSTETDAVLHICSSARRSRMYVNGLAATQSLVLIHNKVRRLSGTRAPLTAWVIDSANMLGGVGVLLAHAARLRDSGAMAANVAVTLNTFGGGGRRHVPGTKRARGRKTKHSGMEDRRGYVLGLQADCSHECRSRERACTSARSRDGDARRVRSRD
jgi:Uncharacterised protein, DegV family COG1307